VMTTCLTRGIGCQLVRLLEPAEKRVLVVLLDIGIVLRVEVGVHLKERPRGTETKRGNQLPDKDAVPERLVDPCEVFDSGGVRGPGVDRSIERPDLGRFAATHLVMGVVVKTSVIGRSVDDRIDNLIGDVFQRPSGRRRFMRTIDVAVKPLRPHVAFLEGVLLQSLDYLPEKLDPLDFAQIRMFRTEHVFIARDEIHFESVGIRRSDVSLALRMKQVDDKVVS
jgi:hypothetical protein